VKMKERTERVEVRMRNGDFQRIPVDFLPFLSPRVKKRTEMLSLSRKPFERGEKTKKLSTTPELGIFFNLLNCLNLFQKT